MACLPRFLRSSSKKSFTPAVDENSETLVNENNPVKIGRYIRRDESPLFCNKAHTHGKLPTPTTATTTNNNLYEQAKQTVLLPATKPLKERDNEQTTKEGGISPTNSNNSNNNIVEGTTLSTNKKFISNRHNNNINAINQANNVHHPKSLKSTVVKQRRPTALPNEIPTIETTDICSNGSGTLSNQSSPKTPSTPTNRPTQFFIGRGEDEDGTSERVSLYYDSSSIRANGSVLSETLTCGRFSITKTPPNEIPTYPSIYLSKAHSFTTTKPRKGPAPRSSSGNHNENEVQKLNIPTPPPLPPQLLTTAASATSLASIRSANSKRHTNASSTSRKNDEGNATEAKDDNDTSPSPKGSDSSDTPQSHRIEGGLIFARDIVPDEKDFEIEYVRKDEATRDLIRSAIESNDFLNNYMDKERKEMVIDAMSPAFYDSDSFIIRENDEGSEIFVSEEGYFDVIKNGKLIGSFGPATVFGELAILYNAKRFASVKAATHSRVWKIDRHTFRQIMIISGSRERQENLNFLKSAPFLKYLSDDVLDKVVDLLQRKFYETNSCIVREGEVGNEFFIIRGGTVTIRKKNDEGVERVVARRKRGEYFGEQALVNADYRLASVYADAPGTEVLRLDRQAFNSYLGTIPQLRERPISVEVEEARENDRKSEFDNEYAHLSLIELKKVETLGAGAFGRVDLVAFGEKTFALKIIKKVDIVKQDQVEHVYNEKHVMMKCRQSPFIIELYKTFRNEKFVYFLMEACMGGDVWTVMSQRRFFDEKTARFIAGCVVEAFDFLHSHNIIYRDLKPENLMLTTDGYCKLVDFGFAKHIPPNHKTNTFAGTPEYVAPEIILDRGHDRAVDYWALGILIFELLVGKTPFREQNQIKIYQKILGGIDVIQMPSKIPKSAQGLIKCLCKQLPAERLGYQRRGIQDIKRHSWFESLDWNKLKTKSIQSPIQRPIASNTDIQYFGPPGVENEHDPPDETSGWDKDF